MFQMQQEMMASNPELLGYQAALMAQQNPMMMQQMQYLWFQQQQQQVGYTMYTSLHRYY